MARSLFPDPLELLREGVNRFEAGVSDALSWSRHVGELRVLVSPAWRGRGLGRLLIQESFALALALSLDKLTVQMTVDQASAIAVFEELGFRAEAVLRDHVKDCDGKTYDLALLSHDVAAVQSRMQAYGVSDALNS
jgi:GNAT superfamily N-acetyltransferase